MSNSLFITSVLLIFSWATVVSVANEEFFHELEEKSAETYKTFTRGIIDDLQETCMQEYR